MSAPEALAVTWKQACLQPSSFFSRMPREAGFGAVLVYYLVIGVIASGVNLFWTSLFNFSGFSSRLLPGMSPNPMSGIVEFLLSPLLLIVTLFLVSGVTHLFLMMAGGANNGFQTTTRVFAFAYSPALLGVVPMLGNVTAFFWMLVLAIVGLREAHVTTTGKAVVAMLLPTALFFALVIMAFVVAAMTGLLRTPF